MNEIRTKEADKVFEAHRSHTSGIRIHTDSAISHAILQQFPKHCVTSTRCDLLKYAERGHATVRIAGDGSPLILCRDFESTMRDTTLSDAAGMLSSRIYFGCYDYTWNELHFRLYVLNTQNSLAPAANESRTYIISQPLDDEIAGQSISASADDLIMAAGTWMEKNDEAVWVYDQGCWQKDGQLWRAVRDTNSEEIVGDEARKADLERDTLGFFDARDQYWEYGVPWKRGLILHGPPGNGKTLTIKAIMRSLMARREGMIPTLYVKSITSRVLGPQGALRVIFNKARQAAPCLLVLEDIDSIVTDEVRSYFFNELDGLENNNGILVIGSTNDLGKLDIGLSQRPSRFDRKYPFHLPDYEERLLYCRRWNHKLSKTPLALLNAESQSQIASLTSGFSFAYMKEAYISALLELARRVVPESVQPGFFADILLEQVKTLKLEMAM